MKALVGRVNDPGCRHLDVIAFEKGDEPDGAVDIPPHLLNAWQIAKMNLGKAEGDIIVYLRETDQETP